MADPHTPFQHALEKLEFERVRQRLLRFVISGLGESMVRMSGPITDRARLETEHASVSEMRGLLETEDTIPVQDIRDIRASLKLATVANTRLDPAEFVELLYTLRASRALRSYFSTHRDRAPLLHVLSQSLVTDKLLERHIELTVDASGRVLDTASKRLRKLRDEIIVKHEVLRKRCASILKAVADKEFTQDDILTQRDGRMVIPLKVEHKRKIPGAIHSVSQTGQTVFVEPSETLELNNEIVALQFEEQKEIAIVLRDLTDRVRAQEPELRAALMVLRELEYFFIRARYSLELNAAPARFVEDRAASIMNARHPLLIAHHGLKQVQPMSVELGNEINTVVISGPNAGGKTIALKTIGLIALMAQSGIHIPADSGTLLPVYDDIFVDMGDDQSVENDLSTFSSHLRTVKEILERSTDRSLVLIDEIGMGTDPNEGGALAMSVLAALTLRHVVTVVTTHHGALKSFAHDTAGVVNAGMEFNVETLAPTYRFRIGRPGSSYAFEIARTLQFPEDVLLDASVRLGTQQGKLETLLHHLEASLHTSEQDRLRYEEERNTAGKLREEYERKVASSTKEARETVRAAKVEARALLDEARALIERTVRELKEKSRDEVRTVRAQFQKEQHVVLSKSSDQTRTVQPEVIHDWQVGQEVGLADSNAVGTILTSPDRSGFAHVQFGTMKLKVRADQLRTLSAKEKRTINTHERHAVSSNDAPRSIDLRGKYGDEALVATDGFLAEAIAAGHEHLEIIHGMGTGVLRRVVHDLLKSHPFVASYRLADWNAGGSGVTVVELKQ